ncbi:hypothetical protein G7046_g6885 [Stylonectria norvegica]|nr:hypothetical protein G7046_g6885 [Stylonectria norvegica]
MLSHLRFHRRAGAAPSNPASPCPEQTPTSPPTRQPSPFSPATDTSSPDRRPQSATSAAFPPTLPPITRVTSADTDPLSASRHHVEMVSQPDSRSNQVPRSPYNGGDSGFIGGVALRNYQRDFEAQDPGSMESSTGTGLKQQQPAPRPTLAPINTGAPTRPAPQVLKNSKPATSFSTPTDLKKATTTVTGRRPAATRLVTEPPTLVRPTTNVEPPKTKKSLPFLKNPMTSLLMRRKNSQHVPDLLPLPLKKRAEEPTYDPRIRGTRVHDFSAPRQKKITGSKEAGFASSPSLPVILPGQEKLAGPMIHTSDTAPSLTTNQRQRSSASDSFASPQTLHRRLSAELAETTVELPSISNENAPPVPPKDDAPSQTYPKTLRASGPVDANSSDVPKSSASTPVSRSRQASVSGLSVKETPSAVPRHMKSTSSRFSFDMIGAAKQEKLLEDRHRQRELEKKTTQSPVIEQDSRFDDFDEDGFDYDAMMDDDGLEERIPGVNADYDEEELYEEEINMGLEDVDDKITSKDDPDDDQENFSGFVFERSNPNSSLTSPRSAGFAATPRDPDGKVIGFAMSKDTPGLLTSLSPNLPATSPLANEGSQASGLGIQGLDLSGSTSSTNEMAFQHNQQLSANDDVPTGPSADDLYFDEVIPGYENEFAEDLAAPPEWDEAPFDESIFDNNDTDKFGRPVPGAFVQAQTQRRASTQDVVQTDDEIPSRFSAHSAASQSTAQTSLSVEGQKPRPENDELEEDSPDLLREMPAESTSPSSGGDQVVAYQAALAAAAYKAAASGKFQRDLSPAVDNTPSSVTSHSPNTPDGEDGLQEEEFADYGDSYEDMGDFDMDDDAIIAEANASALANDSDGWYGQEFGFYSAPASQQQHASHNSSSASVIDYEYANGGFFGPKNGLDRTASGHMVSREPNLTPITERSEYSNRNSIMSLGFPNFGPGTPLQSPGLAQLALLGDRGDEMNLSALLRLRSKAWGGSQASLVSSRDGSPRSDRAGDLPSSPWGPNFFSPTAHHARKNSVLSVATGDSEGASVSGSPTLTTGFQGFGTPPPPIPGMADGRDVRLNTQDECGLWALDDGPEASQLELSISPVTESNDTPMSSFGVSPQEAKSPDSALSNFPSRRKGMGHRHKGSADSISYTKEEDSGATRWVMERRRTGESGQVEILEREILEGGRI